MNESLQQAYDFLDESNAVYELLSSLSDKEFNQPIRDRMNSSAHDRQYRFL